VRTGSADPAIEPDVLPPPFERGQHDKIKRRDHQIQDSRGAIGVPWQVVGILGKFYDSGKIDSESFDGGRRFRSDFRAAQLDQLRARDLSRPFIDNGRRAGEMHNSAVDACERVEAALEAVGGINSVPGSCLWIVIGEEKTLKFWSSQRFAGRITENAAPGVLIAALSCLAAHYRNGGHI
jgi:Domain of unknown function (DUF6456)